MVATISADAQATRLAYADAWRSSPDRFPASLAMPIRPEPYEGELVLPWLMNLLPEGKPLRAMTRPSFFAKEIEERATEVRAYAAQEGVPDVAEMPEPEINSSPTAYE